MRRQRRHEKRHAAARWARDQGSAILFWSGTAAFSAGLLLLLLSQHALAIAAFQAGVAAWIAVVERGTRR
ncbi:hypothetical protein [Streptomyces sp. NPDC057340]|uniref:hypothetical protein n=1 Tax=Streptomyces sp. NPDC057340 TaxID=3346103 RepID=UPI00362FB998